MRRMDDKNRKALIITLIILSLMSVLSQEENSLISSGVNLVTRGLFQVTASATADNGSASAEELRSEVERLKTENAELRAQVSDYIDIKQENARLQKLLDIKKDNRPAK